MSLKKTWATIVSKILPPSVDDKIDETRQEILQLIERNVATTRTMATSGNFSGDDTTLLRAKHVMVLMAWLHVHDKDTGRLSLSRFLDWTVNPLTNRNNLAVHLECAVSDLVYEHEGYKYIDINRPLLRLSYYGTYCAGAVASRTGSKFQSVSVEAYGNVGGAKRGHKVSMWDWDIPDLARRVEDDFIPRIRHSLSVTVGQTLAAFIAWQIAEHPGRVPVIAIPLTYRTKTGTLVVALLPMDLGYRTDLDALFRTKYYWLGGDDPFHDYAHKCVTAFIARIDSGTLERVGKRPLYRDLDAEPAGYHVIQRLGHSASRSRSRKKKKQH